MKFLGGLLLSIATVFLTLWATTWWNNRAAESEYNLSYRFERFSADLSRDDVATLSRRMKDLSTGLHIAFLEVENTGTKPLEDQSMTISGSSGIGGAGGLMTGSMGLPGGTSEGVTTEFKKDSVVLTYKVLNPGETHKLWIAADGFTPDRLTARKPGLKVTSQNDTYAAEMGGWLDDPFTWFMIALFGGGGIFILGVIVNHSSVVDELKKRGYDLQAIMKEEANATSGGANTSP